MAVNKIVLEKLAALEQLMVSYQKKAQTLTLEQQAEQVQQQMHLLQRVHDSLKKALQKDTCSRLEHTLEQAHELSPQELENSIQETWPDFLPTTVQVIDNCFLTVYTIGLLTYEQGGTVLESIPFSINEQAIERLSAKRNSQGTLVIYSNWRYYQKNTDIGFHTTGNDTSHSLKHYKITCSFEVNAAGEVNLYKDTVLKTAEEDTDNADLLFYTRPIEVDLDNSDRLSISGGTSVNTMTVLPSAVKQWLGTKIVGKEELIKTFSLKLSAAPEEEKVPVSGASVEKELVFERENQAVLSSDQLDTLYLWWKELQPETKQAIKEKKAMILVQGYTSSTGSSEYNLYLGEDRARDVSNKLHKIIGKSNGKEIARIDTESLGEWEDNKRYVKIIIVPL